jgi:hypothetical protein
VVQLLGIETDIWTAIAAAVAALVATIQTGIIVAAAVFAYRQVKAAREQVEEARKLREDRTASLRGRSPGRNCACSPNRSRPCRPARSTWCCSTCSSTMSYPSATT